LRCSTAAATSSTPPTARAAHASHEAGLEVGAELEVEFRDGRIELEPATVSMRVAKQAHGFVVEAEAEMPPLSAEAARKVLERTRR
jgi:hypothetical protein